MKKYFLEFIGTFTLALIVATAYRGGIFSLPVSFVVSMAFGMFVYMFSDKTGCHLNPAITLSFKSVGRISTKETAFYIVAQFLGGVAALFIASYLYGIPTGIVSESVTKSFVGEFFGTVLFSFAIMHVASKKVSEGAKGVFAGIALFIGISLAVLLGSRGMLNPAIAFAGGLFRLEYIFGPLIGALFGVKMYEYFINE